MTRDVGRVLVDASNLRTGGALQVASSFLDELAALATEPDFVRAHPWVREGLVVEASPEVMANTAAATAGALPVTVRSSRPGTLSRWVPRRRRFDVSFVVFGPEYGAPRARRRIVGFADGVSLFPDPTPWLARSRLVRLRSAVRRRASRRLFTQADRLVVESPHVRDALAQHWRVDPQAVAVVANTVNAVFTQPSDGDGAVALDLPRGMPLAVYVTRAHPHKNIGFLAAVARSLTERGGPAIRFVLTLTEEEWAAQTEALRACSINAGPLRVEQLPALYARCDLAVFPSLLECFSATPLEALATGTPLVASDRDFVTRTCRDAAWYADPTDPAPWADAVAAVLDGGPAVQARIAAGRRVAAGMPTARDRADGYARVISAALGMS